MNTTRRKIVTLFVDISGFTSLSEQLDPEQIMELLVDDFLSERCVPLVEERGGTIDKIDGDGLMALFGARRTHEDDPIRAVDAVFGMFEKLDEFNEDYRDQIPQEIDLSAGLHRGLSVAGEISEGSQVRFTSYGDAVNTASRLEEEAPTGSIYCSESFYAQVSNYCQAEAVGAVDLKGKSEPITVWDITEKGSSDEETSMLDFEKPFVGREPQKEMLEKLFNHGEDELTGAFVIGKAGRGKSRLVTEALDQQDDDLIHLKAQAYSFEQDMPFQPFLSLIEDFLGCSLPASEEEITERLHNRLSDSEGDISGLIMKLKQLDSLMEDGNDRRKYIEQLVKLFIETVVVSGNVLLHFEDVHWFDESSRNLTGRLPTILEDYPVRFIGTARPDSGAFNSNQDRSLKKIIQNWNTQMGDGFSTVKLGPLKFEESRRLIENYIPNQGIPDDFIRTVHNRSSGIPFSIIHYLQKCYHMGYFEPVEGKAVYRFNASSVDPGIPSSVQDLILSRIDSLGDRPRKVTETASLIGGSFSLPMLSNLHDDLSTKEIQNSVNKLADNVFVQFLDQSERLEFAHDSIPEAVRETVPSSRRKDIHRRILEWYESDSASEVSEEVKYQHAHKAGVSEKIVQYGYQLAEKYWDQGWWDQSREKIETVLEHLGEEYNDKKIKALYRYHALLHHTAKISRKELFDKKQTLIPKADELGEIKLQIKMRLTTLVDAQNESSLRPQGKKHLEEAVKLAEQSGRSDLISNSYLHVCYWESTKRDDEDVNFSRWETYLEQALEHVMKTDNLERWIRLKRNQSYYFERQGDKNSAIEILQEAMGKFDSSIPSTLRLKMTSQCLKLQNEQNMDDGTEQTREHLHRHLEECESPGSRFYAYLQAMKFCTERDDFNQFWQWGEKASITFRDEKQGYWLKRTLTAFIGLLSDSKHDEKAREWFEWGLKTFVQIRDAENLFQFLEHDDIQGIYDGKWFQPISSFVIESDNKSRQEFIMEALADRFIKEGDLDPLKGLIRRICQEFNEVEQVHELLEPVLDKLEITDRYSVDSVLETLEEKMSGITIWDEVKKRTLTGLKGKRDQSIELKTVHSDRLAEVTGTLERTLEYLQSGLSIHEVAKERDYVVSTIEGHVSKLFRQGVIEEDYLRELISPWLVAEVKQLRSTQNFGDELKPYKKELPEEVSYGTIRCALALVKEEEEQLVK